MPRTQLCDVETHLFSLALGDARKYASRGDLLAGYACLLEGLERIAAFADEGEEWASALENSYRFAMYGAGWRAS